MELRYLTASILAMICLPALAQQADMKVVGAIIPPSCIPSFTGGGTLDFGDFSSSTLSATDFTHIGTLDTELTLTCTTGPARVSLSRLVDNRASSQVAGIAAFLGEVLGISQVGESNSFGLGQVEGQKVGSYIIAIPATGATGDGAAVRHIRSNDGGVSWNGGHANGGALFTQYTRSESWAAPGTLAPAAYTTVVQPLRVAVGINKTGDLPALTKRVPLDGLATFTIVYL